MKTLICLMIFVFLTSGYSSVLFFRIFNQISFPLQPAEYRDKKLKSSIMALSNKIKEQPRC